MLYVWEGNVFQDRFVNIRKHYCWKVWGDHALNGYDRTEARAFIAKREKAKWNNYFRGLWNERFSRLPFIFLRTRV